MFSEVDVLVLQEQRKDLLSDLQKQRLLKDVRLQPAVNSKPHRKVINWLGSQLMIWGAKLQSYDTTPISTITVSRMQ